MAETPMGFFFYDFNSHTQLKQYIKNSTQNLINRSNTQLRFKMLQQTLKIHLAGFDIVTVVCSSNVSSISSSLISPPSPPSPTRREEDGTSDLAVVTSLAAVTSSSGMAASPGATVILDCVVGSARLSKSSWQETERVVMNFEN